MPRDFRLSLKRTRGIWTPEKLALAENMCRAGAEDPEIAEAVRMSIYCVKEKMRPIRGPQPKGRKKGAVRISRIEPGHAARIPEPILNDRDQRIAAADRRDYTQTFFGDPPPGYSALDQKRAGA